MASLLSAWEVCFEYGIKGFGLRSASLRVQPGRGLAMVGFNAQGKSTLCRVISDAKLKDGGQERCWTPTSGHVSRHDEDGVREVYASTLHQTLSLTIALFSAVAMLLNQQGSVFVLVATLLLFMACGHWVECLRRRLRRKRHRERVAYVSTECDLAQTELDDAWTLLQALSPGSVSKADSRALAERLLTWSGFRMFANDATTGDSMQYGDADAYLDDAAITCGTLSGGQRHLIYLLRTLAVAYAPNSKLKVLVLDEAFNCLDTHVRPRVLKLVRHLCVELNVGLVVVSQVLHELAVVCDDAVFVHDGAVVEAAPFKDLERSKQPDCKRYLDAYWDLEREMRLAGGKEVAECGAELTATIAELPDIVLAGPPWEKHSMDRGQPVQVVGLGGQRRFNGKRAVVVGQLEDGRFKVRLGDSQTLAVRRANLKLTQPEEKEGSAALDTAAAS